MARENVEMVQALLERWQRGDYDTAEAFDPQVEFTRTGGGSDVSRAPLTLPRVCLRLPNARRLAMYVRVVRFTDVSAERLEGLLARIKESDGPPPGVPSTGLTMLFDEAQGSVVVLQSFATSEDMEAGAKVMSAMDSSETPGTRASVDACEVKLELKA